MKVHVEQVQVVQRVLLLSFEEHVFVDELGAVKLDSVRHYERGFNGARLEKIRMVTDLSELHEHVHDGEEVRVGQRILGPVTVDVLIVQEALSSAQVALDNVLDLFRQLLLDISFHSAEKERPENRLELLNDADVERLVLINTLAEGVREPLLEVLLVAEDLRHQEVHQRPQFHHVVLQRRASQ